MAERRPNIVVIMTDQQKATSLGLYGNPDVQTPAIEQLAASGVRYEHAFTPHPLCVPARTSFWTGTYPHNHGVRTNELRLPLDRPTYARAFHAAGYRLALFGKDHCFQPQEQALFAERVEYSHMGIVSEPTDERDGTFRDWMREPGRFGRLIDAEVTPLAASHCPPARIADEACRFIEESDDRPFLLWASFPEPHEPYYAPAEYAARFDPATIALPPWKPNELADKPERQRLYRELYGIAGQPDEQFRRAVATYYAMVSFVDDAVGEIMAALAAGGKSEDTIVVYLSDHGDYSGEHHMVVKSNAFYDCLTRVPLILTWPGQIEPSQVQPDFVSLIDVMPTLAMLAGLPTIPGSRGRPLPGTGLSTTARDAAFAEYGCGDPLVTFADLDTLPPATFASRLPLLRAREAEGRAKMIRTRDWKYVYDPLDPVSELYDLHDDPWELTNLADRPEYQPVVELLRKRLLDWSLGTEDPTNVPLYFDPVELRNASVPRALPLPE